MKIIVLTENPELYSIRRFTQEAETLGHEMIAMNPSLGLFPADLAATPALILHRASGFRLDNHDLAFSFLWQKCGHKVINKPEILLAWRDKELQYSQLSQSKIPLIPTFSIRGEYTQEIKTHIEKSFSPYFNKDPHFVLKTNIGNGGHGVEFLQGAEELTERINQQFKKNDQKFILQPHLKDAVEYRLLFVKNQLMGVLKKYPEKGQQLHNLSRGASGEFIPSEECPLELREYSNTISRACAFDYAAIDFLKWQDQYFFLEINLVPGFEAFESLSELNIAGKILKEFY